MMTDYHKGVLVFNNFLSFPRKKKFTSNVCSRHLSGFGPESLESTFFLLTQTIFYGNWGISTSSHSSDF
jgi:hypothetical protein